MAKNNNANNNKRYTDLSDQEKRDYHNQKKREFRARQKALREQAESNW